MGDVQRASAASSDVEGSLGALAPRGLAGGNFTHLLLNGSAVNGTRPGSLLSVRRDGAGGGLLLQHLVGDVVVDDRRCRAEKAGGEPRAGAAAAAEEEEEAREKRALQRERAELRRQNDRLRDQLGRLKAIDPAAVSRLPQEAVGEWIADAAAALKTLQAPVKAKPASRRPRAARRAPHDEL